MKNLLLSFSFLFLLAFTSCSKKDDTPVDPEGTLTVSINYTADATPIVLYQGLGGDGPYTTQYGGVWPYVRINVGTTTALNWVWSTAISTENNTWNDQGGSANGEVVNVGSVKGLGNVTSIPTTGWSSTSALEKGHGYVMRYRATLNYSTATSLPYMYARLYVVDWVKNVYGEIIGAKIKYQNNF